MPGIEGQVLRGESLAGAMSQPSRRRGVGHDGSGFQRGQSLSNGGSSRATRARTDGPSEDDDRPRDVGVADALVAFVDLVERDPEGDELVQLEPACLVEVDEGRDVLAEADGPHP
jgi:hypothetical protein